MANIKELLANMIGKINGKLNAPEQAAQPYQQLVTDENGAVMWEKKLAGDIPDDSVFPSVTLVAKEGKAILPYEFFPKPDEQYAINFDGTDYVGTSYMEYVDGGLRAFYIEIPDADFHIEASNGRGTVYVNDSADHTISIAGKTYEPFKIERSYLPRGTIFGVMDSSNYNFRFLNPERGATLNEIRRAVKEGICDIVIFVDLSNIHGYVRYMGTTMFYSDDGVHRNMLFGGMCVNDFTVTTTNSSCRGSMEWRYYYAPLENGFSAFFEEVLSNVSNHTFPLMPGLENAGKYLRVSERGVWGLEDVPDFILTPTTATVGQTIVVKAVDENGKPTEWECADVIIPSSTEGSAKRFKLTVDDSGTITATEVT